MCLSYFISCFSSWKVTRIHFRQSARYDSIFLVTSFLCEFSCVADCYFVLKLYVHYSGTMRLLCSNFLSKNLKRSETRKLISFVLNDLLVLERFLLFNNFCLSHSKSTQLSPHFLNFAPKLLTDRLKCNGG